MVLLVAASCGDDHSTPSAGRPPDSDAIPAGLTRVPDAEQRSLALRLFPTPARDSRWCVFREWPSEQIRVFDDCQLTAPREVPFSRAARGALLAMASIDGGDTLWLLAYDAERNVPSGRVPGVLVDGVDLYQFDARTVSEPRLVVENLPLGGFDALIHAGREDSRLTACAVNRCFSIGDAAVAEWQAAALVSYEFVEVVIAGAAAWAIVRLQDDHVSGNADFHAFHYGIATLRPDGATVERIDADCLPYALTAKDAVPTWKCARTRSDLAELLQAEIARMPHGGMVDFGSSNMEGRIAWSQAYYLSGLMQLGAERMPVLAASHDWTGLHSRLRAELDLLAVQVLSADGLASKRYSLRRSAITFALHMGRVARLLRTASDTGHGSTRTPQAREHLRERLQSLQGAVEELTLLPWAGTEYTTLRYQRGVDFWADGANVPYNYVSGYVDGLLASEDVTRADVARAGALLQPLVHIERVDNAPSWRYWWAWGSSGWVPSDDISTNTPVFAGSAGVGHITYRSMDAAAVLRLHALRGEAVPAEAVVNIRQLVSQGRLLPWVNEAIAPTETVTLDHAVAYRYGRSAAPWELQSQVWALEQLAASQ